MLPGRRSTSSPSLLDELWLKISTAATTAGEWLEINPNNISPVIVNTVRSVGEDLWTKICMSLQKEHIIYTKSISRGQNSQRRAVIWINTVNRVVYWLHPRAFMACMVINLSLYIDGCKHKSIWGTIFGFKGHSHSITLTFSRICCLPASVFQSVFC